MDPLQQEIFWLQVPALTTIIGIVLLLIGIFSKNNKYIRWGMSAFLVTAVAAAPVYYAGLEAVAWLKSEQMLTDKVVDDHLMDSYATVIAAFFLGITALMALLMMRALNRVPKLFLYPILIYGILLVAFIAWRQIQIL